MAWKSVATGVVGLAVLDRLVTLNPGAQGRLAQLLQAPARWARRFLDPSVPLLPDLSGGSSSGSSAQAPGQPAVPNGGHNMPASFVTT